MKNIIIVGAGGLGRELEFYLTNNPQNDFVIKGYLDDNSNALSSYPSNYSILDQISNYKFSEEDYVLLAFGDSFIRSKIKNYLQKKRVSFLDYFHSSSIISEFFKYQSPCIICPTTIISTNVNFGENVLINSGCIIGHDVVFGDNVSLMANINIGGNCSIGNNVYIGTSATIIPGITIGDNIKIGAGSVVIRNLKKPGTYFGNPASLIK